MALTHTYLMQHIVAIRLYTALSLQVLSRLEWQTQLMSQAKLSFSVLLYIACSRGMVHGVTWVHRRNFATTLAWSFLDQSLNRDRIG